MRGLLFHLFALLMGSLMFALQIATEDDAYFIVANVWFAASIVIAAAGYDR